MERKRNNTTFDSKESFLKRDIIKQFINDSPQVSPKPQASSTFVSLSHRNKVSESSLLDGFQMGFPSLESSASSFGVIDIDKISLFSENDSVLSNLKTGGNVENVKKTFLNGVKMDCTNRMKDRLSQVSINDIYDENECEIVTSSDMKSRNHKDLEYDSLKKLGNEIKQVLYTKTLPNSENSSKRFSNNPVGKTYSINDDDFISGSLALEKFKEDEKENRKNYDTIPSTPINISPTSDDISSSRVSSIAKNYFKPRSYSIRDLSDILPSKNKNTEPEPIIAREPLNKRDNEVVSSSVDEIPEVTHNSTSMISSVASVDQLLMQIIQSKSPSDTPTTLMNRLISEGMSKKDKDDQGSKKSSSVDSSLDDTPVFSATKLYDQFSDPPETIKCSARDYYIDSKKMKPRLLGNRSSDEEFGDFTFKSRSKKEPVQSTQDIQGNFKLVATTCPFEVGSTVEESHSETCNFVSLAMEDELNNKSKSPNNSSETLKNSLEPVKRLTSIICTANENDNDASIIQAGTVCIGTQVEVLLSLVNPSTRTLTYQARLIRISTNGVNDQKSASVLLNVPSSNIQIKPIMETSIGVIICPLLCGNLEIAIKFENKEKQFSDIFQIVKLKSEKPKIKLKTTDTISFGILQECSQVNHPLSLKNEGHSRVPIKIVIKEGCKLLPTFLARLTLDASETFDCNIQAITREIKSEHDMEDYENIAGLVSVSLDTTEEITTSVILQNILLSAKVSCTRLMISSECNPLTITHIDGLYPSYGFIRIMNVGLSNINLTNEIFGDHVNEFSIMPTSLSLIPKQKASIKVYFKPNTNNHKRDIDVCFQVSGSHKQFIARVIGVLEPVVTAPPSPRRIGTLHQVIPPTPKSASSGTSSVNTEGPLELDCTQSTLSWVSVPVHTKQIQSLTLRNKSMKKENILLTVYDIYGSFKFVENDAFVKEIRLTLAPRESHKVNIAFTPFMPDRQVVGKVTINRRTSLESSTDHIKKVIPLYGYGGVGNIFTNVFHDSDNRLWFYPDVDFLEAKFTIENTGDCVTFVKIIADEPDDIIEPDQRVLLPKESVEIQYRLCLTSDRVELILKQNHLKDILTANKLTILYGNESTRLRITRLWKNFQPQCTDNSIPKILEKLNLITDMDDCCESVNVTGLLDSPEMVSKLYFEGVTEKDVGVLIRRQDLNSVCLDTTVVFKDLMENTVLPQ